MTTTVLFVDDETNVLSGLRRMLRGQRLVWDMHFAESGQQALDMLKKKPFDVVVSDMRMPDIDGARLLGEVAALYPKTVRLVLSGQSELEKILRSVGTAHQFMSKPCPPGVLIETIDRACGLCAHLDDESLRSITTKLASLPSLPKIYQELLHDIDSEDTCVRSIAAKIESDLGMSTKVLQLVNSSFFGLPQKVSSPSHAVSLLGLNIIRHLILSAGVFSQFDATTLGAFSLTELVDHSLEVATLARQISQSESCPPHMVDDAFIAGMLHDVGKLILATNMTQEFLQAYQMSREESITLATAEKRVFGCTHAQVGAHLLGLWGLTNPIVEAVAFHHAPSALKQTRMSPLTAVHIADAIAYAAKTNEIADIDRHLDKEYLESLGLSSSTEYWLDLVQVQLGGQEVG